MIPLTIVYPFFFIIFKAVFHFLQNSFDDLSYFLPSWKNLRLITTAAAKLHCDLWQVNKFFDLVLTLNSPSSNSYKNIATSTSFLSPWAGWRSHLSALKHIIPFHLLLRDDTEMHFPSRCRTLFHQGKSHNAVLVIRFRKEMSRRLSLGS